MKTNKEQPTISFKSKLFKIDTYVILNLPQSASEKLSSRGLVMIEGTINGVRFQTALEPDGRGSHWFEVDKTILDKTKVDAGDTVELVIEQSVEWIEPKVPTDLKKALSESSHAQQVWKDITPFARWEWIRWIQGTKAEETRQRRVRVAISKLNADKRRPCCFNSRECTVPYVSNGGILLNPSK